MPSSSDIPRNREEPPRPTRSEVSPHRFMVPVVRPLPRPGVGVPFDTRVW